LADEIFQVKAQIAANSGSIGKIRNEELEDFIRQGRVPRIDQRFPCIK